VASVKELLAIYYFCSWWEHQDWLHECGICSGRLVRVAGKWSSELLFFKKRGGGWGDDGR
jgi:hypothetical protein